MLYILYQKSCPTPVFVILTLECVVSKGKSGFLIYNLGHAYYKTCLMIFKITENSKRGFASTTMQWHLPLWMLRWEMREFKGLVLSLFVYMVHSISLWELAFYPMINSLHLLSCTSMTLWRQLIDGFNITINWMGYTFGFA
jgi:hypothetical protein